MMSNGLTKIKTSGMRAVFNSLGNKNPASSLRASLSTAVARHGGNEGSSNGQAGSEGRVHALALAAGLALAAAKAYSERERFSLKAETSEVKVHENRVRFKIFNFLP